VIGDGRILIFGGQVTHVETLEVLSDVHIYDTVSNTWVKPQVESSRGPPGLARYITHAA
jgi:N-acetylneuraminic acid mutarotase